ncbi:hypothetical protein GCK72_010523 [Caenorhabditis remanei]|uniref:Uncharacterized protein n=1 Tax=Caenorhabditis remanei TaxID=31234 RepID=A0A6A5H5P7_CAERE|nr:hypothetical protein GCK72_010523 [Caenorhabditis remanei]KAF1762261.1 hypothetical protein GCK72_010523 [Caenorhabditis remanei]
MYDLGDGTRFGGVALRSSGCSLRSSNLESSTSSTSRDFVDFAVFGADGFRVALADTATLDLAALMETVGGSATSAIIA